MRLLPLILALTINPVQAATLLCGEMACEDAPTEIASWPDTVVDGVPLRAAPRVMINIPTGFDSMHQHMNMISYYYPTEDDEKRVIYLISSVIRPGEVNGTVGRWDTLYRTEDQDLLVYYYQSASERNHYNAIVRNKTAEKYGVPGRITFLKIGLIGFEEVEFLSILGSLRSAIPASEE